MPLSLVPVKDVLQSSFHIGCSFRHTHHSHFRQDVVHYYGVVGKPLALCYQLLGDRNRQEEVVYHSAYQWLARMME